MSGHEKHVKKHHPLDVSGFIEKCQSVGLDGVEILDKRFQPYDKYHLNKTRRRAEELDLKLEFSHQCRVKS
jgi:hypothetical protein